MKSLCVLLVCFSLLVLPGPIAAQQYGPWSAPVNLGPPVNSGSYAVLSPVISKDGLSLYIYCMNGTLPCPEGVGVYVSQRLTLNDSWGQPQFLAVATGDPNLSQDGHRMYFHGPGTTGLPGDTDIYVSRRHNKRDDFGWRTPENLVPVNSPGEECCAFPFEDEATGVTYLYFVSNRTDLGGPGEFDIYVSVLQPDETFGPPQVVAELSSTKSDRQPVLRRDGLEMFFISNRPGSFLNARGLPSFDLWTSTRASTADPWSPPVNVDADEFGNLVSNINTGRHDNKASLSFDGTTLYFGSAQRQGNLGVGCPFSLTCYFDIWMATREKLGDEESTE